MDKFESISKFIGNTPLLKLDVTYNENIVHVYAKCEWYNLSGSVKDRAALSMIKNINAKCGDEIVEVTSGNMGISLASIGALLKIKVTIFMPNTMSEERKKLIKLYGANLILCDDFDSCFESAKKYAEKNGAKYCRQFENDYNRLAQENIGKEILEKTTPDAFVSGVGTGGTLSGAGGYLKKHGVHIIAIDPASSSILTLGYSKGEHKIQGLSDGLIPALYNKDIVEKIIPITDDDALAMAQKLNKMGIPCGISGGANFLGSVLSGYNNVATVFADDNKKYLSTDLCVPVTTPLVEKISISLPNQNFHQ